MVRYLYLLRHGHAEHGHQIDDFDRELTGTGVANLLTLSAKLKAAEFAPDLIFCSSARRTQQTAEVVTNHIGYQKPVEYLDEIYEASVKQLFEVIATADVNNEHVMLIGHNPSISFLSDYLAKEDILDLAPGQLAKIAFVDQDWSEITKGSGTYQEI